jgi:hypothetical protein
MLMTALVALLGLSGTAVAAKRLITGTDIKNGSITTVDLAKSAHDDLKGARGNKGEIGVTGGKGLTGKTGARGGKGAGGANGGQGVAGTNGAQGIPGANGLNGIQGAQGPVGNRGDVGTAGTNGATGATGATGAAGVGTQGVPGTPAVRYFAAVSSTGTVSRSNGVLSASGTSGVYDVTTAATDLAACVATAQAGIDADGIAGSAVAVPINNGHVTVKTWDSVGTATNESFVVTVSC